MIIAELNDICKRAAVEQSKYKFIYVCYYTFSSGNFHCGACMKLVFIGFLHLTL